jgi:UPF0176 protein
VNEACHLLFIQCEDCKAKFENCCSAECHEVIHLPLEEQVKLRRGIQIGNKIFRKGKSEKLVFKKSGEQVLQKPIAPITETKTAKIKKLRIGKGEHYYSKSQVGLFILENDSLKIGDAIIFQGPSTGTQTHVITEMKVNGSDATSAKAGDKITMPLPFKIRSSDKVYIPV